ncbi:vitamin K epoxide reductase family protein [Jatrophihabitans endophyticus]|uniref:vitamin K epoxide reductase family protein n=1 Tax=Jatrophihabitans endophyticus TaxID=1206085 RepID=UPI0019E23BBE|nr:vitamin K epoxide reductase family protein [Jatrophihabitans endophyticus]MBE7187063.1 vitamin K epoxide reductase family protein [Jatrophihabitans endophyticus]
MTAHDSTGTRSTTRYGLGSLVPAVLGLAVAIYLTVEHFTSSLTLACPESATVNCQKVTTSSYSHLLGVPVALGGAIYFVVMVGLLSPPAWAVRALDPVRVVAVVLGVVSVLYLVWAELFRIDAICIWCTVVHVCTVWMFGAVLWYVTGRSTE